MKTKEYKCLYNHDMCSIASCVTPYLDYEGEITREQVEGFVLDVKDTDVDAFLCCPNMLRRALWYSNIDQHWTKEVKNTVEPPFTHDYKYLEKVYYRIRRYMLSGGDPVRETYNACKRLGIGFFISYRMNDAHVLDQPSTPTIDTFWRENPQYRIGKFSGNQPMVSNKTAELLQNYLLPEVRDHYFSLLEELVQMFDIDGLELDFMRAPCFFAPEFIEEGTQIMTEFARRIRNMLDRYGKERGKFLPLCVRVPDTIDKCNKIGLDVVRWDNEKLINMVNVSSSFLQTLELDIKGFKENLKNSRVYGEMHFALARGLTGEGFPIVRHTTREIYQTTAHTFLSQGADGVSLFNFTFCRHHQFNEPRRAAYPGAEPPFDILKGITSLEYLSGKDRHYFTRTAEGALPAFNYVRVPLSVYLDNKNYKRAVVRVECSNDCRSIPVSINVNGTPLKEFVTTGELFEPLTIEALPRIENVRHFDLPLELVTSDRLVFEIRFSQSRNRSAEIIGLEVAFYR